jgi:transposase
MFVGIDVSKDRLDVHLRPSGEAFAVARDDGGLEQLVARLAAARPELIVLEATGGFEITVATAVAAAGMPLAIVNPAQIRAFARAVGRLAKTDRLDAALIARFAEQVRPTPRPVADERAQALAELVVRRRQIVAMVGMESNRRRQARGPRSGAASSGPSGRSKRSSPNSTGRSTSRSGARPPGGPPRICSSRCPASVGSPPAP